MKKTLLLLVSILYGFGMSAQNNSVAIKLLSSEPSEKYENDLPSTYEYDSENRVSRIQRTTRYGESEEITVEYSENQIVVNITTYGWETEYDKWVMTLENRKVIKDERFRHGSTTADEICTYTYDSNGKITHIEREVPVETDRNMSYDLQWENGLLVLCNATWMKNGKTAQITFTYTDIEDNTLANYFVSPFANIDNYKTGEYGITALLDCHGFYGWQSTRLPLSITELYNGKESNENFTYTLDSENRVSSFTHDYYGEHNVTTTLVWGERVSAIESHIVTEGGSKSRTYDLKGIPVSSHKGVHISNGRKMITR